jgi:hypothetical protein
MAGWQEAALDAATLDWLTDRIVDALARDERVNAAALQFLLRRYSDEAREDLAEPLGTALARELDRQAEHGCTDEQEGWIALFGEAAAISDDPRLPRAAMDLLDDARSRWSRSEPGAVDEVMRSVEACLLCANLPGARDLAAEAVDALERVVAGAYRPGQGVAHESHATFARGGLADHVCSASALLTAYMLTARLPYAMLADELVQSVLRTPPEEADPTSLNNDGRAGINIQVTLNCELARLFCRLAALHRDEEYRRAAILPVDEDYAADARRTLTALAPSVHERGIDAAPFGLALVEWLKVR